MRKQPIEQIPPKNRIDSGKLLYQRLGGPADFLMLEGLMENHIPGELLENITDRVSDLAEAFDGGVEDHAGVYRDDVIPAMEASRAASDALETIVDDELWRLPKYWQMLFLR